MVPSENKYLYNGKELQDELLGSVNLDWYDYGARMYDPALGRFHTMDPLSEIYSYQSPFAYAANNPISNIDFMGMSPLGVGGDVKYTVNGMEISPEMAGMFMETYVDDDPKGNNQKTNSRSKRKSKSKNESDSHLDEIGGTLEVVGFALVEVAKGSGRYATVLITRDGRAVAVSGQSAYNRFLATGNYKTPALKSMAKNISKHASELGLAGNTARFTGTTLAGFSIGRDIIRFRNGKISGETFTVNTLTTGVAEVVGISISGLTGSVMGATVGAHLYLGYKATKAFHQGLWNWMDTNFNPTNWNSVYNLGL
jgi:RHS repeat-associated protein